MSFNVGIHYKNGTTSYSREGEDWTVIKRWAAMASRDPEVKQTLLNCEGITQIIYVNGRVTWEIAKAKNPQFCLHYNTHA